VHANKTKYSSLVRDRCKVHLAQDRAPRPVETSEEALSANTRAPQMSRLVSYLTRSKPTPRGAGGPDTEVQPAEQQLGPASTEMVVAPQIPPPKAPHIPERGTCVRKMEFAVPDNPDNGKVLGAAFTTNAVVPGQYLRNVVEVGRHTLDSARVCAEKQAERHF